MKREPTPAPTPLPVPAKEQGNSSRCRAFSLVGSNGHETVIQRLNCGSWNCPSCRRHNTRKLIRRATGGRPDRLLTLTVNPAAFENPDDAAQKLKEAWRRARQEMRRQRPNAPIPMLAVWERTKRGWPHLHVLIRGYRVPRRWLSDYLGRRIASPIVDVRRLTSIRQAVNYVTKYVAKNPTKFEGCKRYWSNTAYCPTPITNTERNHTWTLYRASPGAYSLHHGLLLTHDLVQAVSGNLVWRLRAPP